MGIKTRIKEDLHNNFDLVCVTAVALVISLIVSHLLSGKIRAWHINIGCIFLYVFSIMIYRIVKFAIKKDYGALKANLLVLSIQIILAAAIIYSEMCLP